MKNAKKGLRLLSFSIILNITWAITYSILNSVAYNAGGDIIKNILTFLSYGVLITSIVSLICFFIDLYALRCAGKDNKHFHRASFLKILSIICGFVCFILSIVIVANVFDSSKTALVNSLELANSSMTIFVSIAEVVVLSSVIKGCKEISPRVKGLSIFVYICFIGQLVLAITSSFLVNKLISQPNFDTFKTIIFVLGIIYPILATTYTVSFVLLIFRTTANIGKERK